MYYKRIHIQIRIHTYTAHFYPFNKEIYTSMDDPQEQQQQQLDNNTMKRYFCFCFPRRRKSTKARSTRAPSEESTDSISTSASESSLIRKKKSMAQRFFKKEATKASSSAQAAAGAAGAGVQNTKKMNGNSHGSPLLFAVLNRNSNRGFGGINNRLGGNGALRKVPSSNDVFKGLDPDTGAKVINQYVRIAKIGEG